METATYRKGTENDCREVYGMLRDMREEEDRISEFTITCQDFQRDGFGDEKLFDTIVVEEPDDTGGFRIIGFATYFYGYNGEVGKLVYLEDLFIKKDYRGNGYGTKLFKMVAEVAAENGTQRMIWGVFDDPTKTNRALGFYKSLDAVDCDIRQLYLPLTKTPHQPK